MLHLKLDKSNALTIRHKKLGHMLHVVYLLVLGNLKGCYTFDRVGKNKKKQNAVVSHAKQKNLTICNDAHLLVTIMYGSFSEYHPPKVVVHKVKRIYPSGKSLIR